jgi:deoxyribonuclease-4
MALFGAHVSSAGSVLKTFERARELSAEVFQFFLGSPRSWRRGSVSKKLVSKFSEELESFGGPVILHASYLINLATGDRQLRERSVKLVIEDLLFCEEAGVHYYNVHPGRCRSSDPEEGIANVIASLEEILSKVDLKRTTLLIENTAGARGDVGKSLEELGRIVSWFGDCRIGVCIDTCHAFAYGYEINSEEGFRRFKEALKEKVGLERVKLIHANDSRMPLGSKRDRHHHIGKGYIGTQGFRNFLKDPHFSRLPYCIETPAEGDMDRVNLRVLREIYRS